MPYINESPEEKARIRARLEELGPGMVELMLGTASLPHAFVGEAHQWLKEKSEKPDVVSQPVQT